MNNNNFQNNKGFTLLEMIVSMGIFTIVAVIAVGSLVRISSLNRQAQSLQAATNNINYILESMSREMRVGSTYDCFDGETYDGPASGVVFSACNPNSESKGILFRSSNADVGTDNSECNLVYGYWFKKSGDFWSISKSQQNDCTDPVMTSILPLVDNNNVSITGVVLTNERPTGNYARFGIELSGYAGKKENEKVDFKIRTMISQRIRD